MDDSVKIALALSFGYLLGSVPTAYLVVRIIRGIDIRRVGSGNVGASNVWIHVGKRWAFPIGAFDMFVKGMGSTVLALALGLELEWRAAAGMLAVVGHNWPVFLRFEGGRGLAPAVGVLIALARLELAVFILMGLAGWRLTNDASPWALAGFVVLLPLSLYWERPDAIVLLMGGLLLVTAVKRLTSNRLRGTGVPMRQLIVNRLLFDRDIADHDAWVRRDAAARE